MSTESELLELLRAQGARIEARRGDRLEARWRGAPVRASLPGATDVRALAAAFEALAALPDPLAVAEIDLARLDSSGRQPVFVPVVSRAEGEALAVLAGDSFLVILDRDTGAMTVLGRDVAGSPLALQHRLPRATPHGDPARLAQPVPAPTEAAAMDPAEAAGIVPAAGAGTAPAAAIGTAPAGAAAAPKWRRLLPLLRCVRCEARAPLEELPFAGRGGEPSGLGCTGCGERYELRGGTPILLRDPAADGEPPPGPVSSNSYSRQSLALMHDRRDGWVLDCGCGLPASSLPHVVNLEVVRFPNVDVVASADALPFADEAFDAAICESVLEHVPDPWLVAAELRRVLKPLGVLRVDAPFLAPFHAYPDHYHNFTRSGLDQLLSGFEKLDGGIGPHQEPWVAFTWILRLLREGLPDEALRRQLDATSVGELLQALDRGVPPRTLHPLDDASRLALAAGFFFYGRKPAAPAAAPR
jgi:SAM-dependent methyltransferase